jgi:hypothetical protein
VVKPVEFPLRANDGRGAWTAGDALSGALHLAQAEIAALAAEA